MAIRRRSKALQRADSLTLAGTLSFAALGVPFHDHRRFIAPIAAGWRPFGATIGPENPSVYLTGDAMDYDSDSLIKLQREARLRRQRHAEYQQIVPKIEMRVSAWYVDEFGNQTREVEARD
jgi:hypothetical protein